MEKKRLSDRSLALRQGAESYLLTCLVSFAFSVIAMRLFLELTGYPQIGSETLHIAHVLWGGLLLFIGGLLPLVLANAWAFLASAVLSGAGMGLFIDEIGKFITQANDYFYPPAAPIIYAFFLLVVLLYLYIRRSVPHSPRQTMYQALHDLGEVLDHDLQPYEKDSLKAKLLDVLQKSPHTNLGRLAFALIQFLEAETLELHDRQPTAVERFRRWLGVLEDRARRSWLTERRFRLLLGFVLALSAGLALAELSQLMAALFMQGGLVVYFVEVIRNSDVQSLDALRFIFIRLILEGSLSLLLLAAVFLLFSGHRMLGVRLAVISLVMSLTTVDLLIFYLDQFSATLTVLAQFGLLLLTLLYRRLHLLPLSVID
jgi:hypothetical protein